MSYKKKIITVMTLLVLLLLTMSTTIQAASVGKVYNLNATMNGSQIKLTWDKVSNALGYNVYVNDVKIGSVTSNSASLIGFANNTTYRFKVAAYDSQRNEGTKSNETKLTTNNKTTLGNVTNLTITQANGFVTLNWSAVSNADTYQIFVDVPNVGEEYIGKVSTTNAMLGGFKEGKKYGFSIRACQTLSSGEVNYGNKSSMKYCTINSNTNNDDDNNNNDSQNIGTVKNVKVSDITDTEATVTWSKNTNADGYEVKLSRNGGSYKTVKDTTKTNAYLYDLYSGNSYKVKIVPYEKINGKKVYGEESSYKSFSTEEDYTPDKVKNLSVSDVEQNRAYISWSKVKNATGYNIYVSEDGRSFKHWDSTTSRHYTLKKLDDDTRYKVKVEAYRKVNGKKYTGSYSATKSFTTLEKETKPAAVTNLKAYMKEKTVVNLSWKKVPDAAGYEVDFTIPGIGGYTTMHPETNSIDIIGIIGKYDYTARVRAYKYINGVKTYGAYSNTVRFREK